MSNTRRIERTNNMTDTEINTFPQVEGKNLNKREVSIPSDLDGKLNLVIVAFQQWQQRDVNSWVPLLTSLREKTPEFQYYELPTIRKMNRLYQRVIDGGMRAGIPSLDTREHTITLYIDKQPVKESLNIKMEDTIHLYLIDREGIIYREWKGPFSELAGRELIESLKSIRISSKDL